MSYADNYEPAEGIAIIAVAGRFPGARTVDEFWQNLVAGRETIARFTEAELEPGSPVEMENRSDPAYVKARGILEDVELFDAAFFRMSPREADVTDPQQRLFLETAWEALERAGYDPETYAGSIGVFAGMGNNTYFRANLLGRPDLLGQSGELPMLGNEKDYLATRVSYKLNLRGPSLNIVTACSTSLVAVCQAFQSLVTHQCDMALAGGVSISLPQRRGYLYQEGFITSPDGHCRAFDEKAQGTVFSNGLGIVVLKRLEDALADRDTIYAVIKGIGLNNDGSERVSFTAPSVNGQSDAISMAQAVAGIDPGTISYVEAHGTGTSLGDPVEIAGLTRAFRLETKDVGFCALGSVKTNIGHLDAAAGVTGLIKTALALHHETLPATLHFGSPNPKLDLANTPFHVNTELRAWPRTATPRRAGVSSLGAGGTNAHVVLEEAPAAPEAPAAGRKEQLLLLSARTPAALESATSRLREHLEAHPDLPLSDVAFTLQAGRHRFDHRRSFVCSSREEAIALCTTPDSKRVTTEVRDARRTRTAFLFPGQGAQYVNMGRGLYEAEPRFRTEVDECAEVLRPLLGLDLREVLYPGTAQAAEAQERINETAITQPALFVIEYALAQLWREWGVEPDAMAGHSLGEYVAACLAGVFSRDDALVLLARRGRLMQDLPGGLMLAVRAGAADVAPLLNTRVSIAGINAPNVTVISGDHEAIGAVEEVLRGQGVAAKALATSHAFHSPMMDAILDAFASEVRRVQRHAPRLPFLSSLTGDWITPEAAVDPHYWARQLREAVRFLDMGARLVEYPERVLLEVGPGRTLATLVRQQPARATAQAVVASLDSGQEGSGDVESLLRAAGRLWSAGADLDWVGLHGGDRRRRVPLPTYPFERKRHWVDPVEAANAGDIANPAALVAPAMEAPYLEDEESMTQQGTNAQAQGRRAELVTRLQTLFAELSGIAAADLDPAVSLLELGFDSLVLTQASSRIQKTFGVKVAFKDLLDEASTLDALSARIDQQLPPEPVAPRPEKPAPPVAAPTAAATGAPSPAALMALVAAEAPRGAMLNGGVASLIAQQLELMSRQLEMLRGEGALVTSATPSRDDAALKSPPSHTPVVVEPPRPRAEATVEPAKVAFGPYRPPAKGPTGGLTPRQEQGLKELVDRYTRRTDGSKRLAAECRPFLADPRTVAGFRLMWKEMVYPIVSVRSAGSKLWDVDGNEYVDLTNGFGMILFGHNPGFVREAIDAQLQQGIEVGPQTPLAGEVARLVSELTSMERVAFCNTGSEAVMAAIRVARTVTGRDRIAMFTGAYHGIFDEVLVRPGGGGPDLRSMPIAPGIPSNMVENILVLDYGAPESLRILEARGSELAAVLVEPVQSRRPELQPVEFLHELRAITERTQTALIFDEVVSGFRVHPGGAQAAFGIRADIATYGKVAGGGLPIGLVAGKAEYMDALDGGQWRYGDESIPEVGVTFFAGTFVRHPLALAAARAVLLHLKRTGPELQRELNLRTTRLVDDLNACAERLGAPVRLTHFSSWFCFNFPADLRHASLFYAYMRAKGVHVWEGRAGFLTTAHTEADIERVQRAFEETLLEMQDSEFLPRSVPEPPIPGARKGRDAEGNEAWFVPDPERPGKYLQVSLTEEVHG